MERCTHGNPQSLGLVTPGDDAAVVVGKHHYWLPRQGRVKDPLAGAEEVVAVDEGQAAMV